ncbi:MAG: serine hydrolase domain-containing protein [Bacteriovorax sp.]
MNNKILFFFYITFISAVAAAGPVVEISSIEDLNSYISKSEFNGVVLVAKDKKVLMREAFGYKNLETKVPLTTSDKFQIGSNSKQFVAASLLKLQEEGRVSLNDSIEKYLPQLSIYKNIKLRDILNHTSGISNFTDHQEFWEMLDYNKTLTLDDIVDFTAKFPLEFEPRSKWNYSNSGYIIAGKIIEVVTGKSWDKYIEDNFLVPLEMKNTGYQEYFEKASDVTGHVTKDDKSVPFTEFNLSWALSAGALYSNVDDLLKWTSIYEDSTLLSGDSKKEMQTPFLGQYGLGLWIQPYNNDLMITHSGRTPGFVSKLIYLKNSKLKVISLDNVDGKFSGISNLLLSFFTNGKATAIKLNSYPVSAEALQDYVGTYSLEKFEMRIFIDSGKLFLQTNDGQPPYQMKANDLDSFSLGFAAEEFIRDGAGKIIGLKHYQGEHVAYFAKKELITDPLNLILNKRNNKKQRHYIFKDLLEKVLSPF